MANSELQALSTELQSNNVDLQTILDTVNALPEASAGVEIETCTVTLVGDALGEYSTGIYYLDKNLEFQTFSESIPEGESASFEVVKKSMMYCFDGGAIFESSLENVFPVTANNQTYSVIGYVTNDVTIYVG